MIRINTICLLIGGLQPRTAFRHRLMVKQLHSFQNSECTTTGKSLDVNLIFTQPNLIADQLRKRNAETNFQPKMERIHALKVIRLNLIRQGDVARGTRKKLSKEIGECLMNNRTANVDVLKASVEENNEVITVVDAELVSVENELNVLFSQFPNLLDDR